MPPALLCQLLALGMLTLLCLVDVLLSGHGNFNHDHLLGRIEEDDHVWTEG